MVAVYFGDALARYGFGEGHPFGPDRLQAFWQETVQQGLDKQVAVAVPVLGQREQLQRFHTSDYVERVIQQSVNGEGFLDYGDTPAFKGVFDAGATVVGSALDGLHSVMTGAQHKILVPIGGLHHARREQAAGFCVFNDPGVLIETLRAEYGVRRVAYVDIDAHHGDGVFYAFEDDPDVIFADIHEDGRYLYPGTGFAHESGKGEAAGTKLNIPVPPGADDAEFHRQWPRVEEFLRDAKPQMILLQAGADSVAGDPITHMAFTPAAHGHAAASLAALADEFCDGRMIAMGGGGYNRRNLALAWNAVLEALVKRAV
ncbi:MAG: acetoin utilization protein AcuC [Gammaproteobacteria bacterium]|nr:acetoin utilization protein AcuC [Gammaproteobacteria bacterium]